MWLATAEFFREVAAGNYLAVQRLLETKIKGDWFLVYGASALYDAVEKSHEEIVDLLMQHVAPINWKDDERRTVLHLAAAAGNERICQMLIEHKEIDIGIRDDFDRTALHTGLQNGHREIVVMLLDKGANIEAQSANNWTPLHWAAMRGHEEVAKLLLERNFNAKCKLVETSIRLSMTARESAERKQHADQGREYAEKALNNARGCEDDCMVARAEFMLACVGAWKVYVAARMSRVEPSSHPKQGVLSYCWSRGWRS